MATPRKRELVTVAATVPPVIQTALRQKATRLDRTVSYVIRQALVAWLAAGGAEK